MATPRTVLTDAQLMELPKDGRKYELVDGEVQVVPAGRRHGRVTVKLVSRLDPYVDDKRLGMVFDSSTGFRMPSGNVRAPDLSFVATTPVPAGDIPPGFGESVPDLAVEVLSPDDDGRKVLDKVGEYLAAGARLVWVIDPERRCAVAYRSVSQTRQIGEDDFLDGEDVVPGFRLRLGDLFS